MLPFQRFQDAARNEEELELLAGDLRDLGPWLLSRSCRERIASRPCRDGLRLPPEPRPRCGAANIVFARPRQVDSVLPNGFLLPVHWQSGDSHDPRLPEGLRDFATELIGHLEGHLQSRNYSLHLMHEPGRDGFPTGPTGSLWNDLETEEMGYRSAFASLAAALIMRDRGEVSDLRTAATGAWNARSGIVAVDAIAQKTRAVTLFPEGGKPWFQNWFVPAGRNVQEAMAALDSAGKDNPLRVMRLEPGQLSPLHSISSLLALSGSRPPDDAGFGALTACYQRLMAYAPEEAKQYYREVLYPQVVERCVSGGVGADCRPTHLVSVVSSPALVGIAVQLLRIRNVLILHTVPGSLPSVDPAGLAEGTVHPLDYSGPAKKAEGLAREAGAENICVKGFDFRPELTGDDLRADVTENLRHATDPFLKDLSPGKVVWDMTSGLRIFSHACDKGLAREGNWMLYLGQVWSAGKALRIPLTESVLLWQHGSDWPGGTTGSN